jgi:multiple sugar transport system ATP-binding protein
VRAAAARDQLSEIVLGIRPEHLHLAADGRYPDTAGQDGAGAGAAELTGEVLLVEELGADALLHVRLAGGDPVVARAEGRKPPAPGVRVTFRVDPADVFAFHPVTGARLAG